MIGSKRVLGVITARGGSKGLPGKNVRIINGKPLVAWTIEAALESNLIDRVILSSDDAEIIKIAKKWKCDVPFVRPENLAHDDSPIEGALVHALDNIAEKYYYIVLLQATSPLRIADDIDGCIEACHRNDAPSCISVCPSPKSPYLMFTLQPDRQMSPLFDLGGRETRRRQDLPDAVVPNGAVYVSKVSRYRQDRDFYVPGAVAYQMPEDRSVDIDAEFDLRIMEAVLASRHLTQ